MTVQSEPSLGLLQEITEKKSSLRIQGIRKSLALMVNESHLVDKGRLPANSSKGS